MYCLMSAVTFVCAIYSERIDLMPFSILFGLLDILSRLRYTKTTTESSENDSSKNPPENFPDLNVGDEGNRGV